MAENEITSMERYSIAGAWSKALHALKGSPWEPEDLAETESGEVGEALKYAYDKVNQDEDGVRAVLRATAQDTSMVSPVDVVAMADGFQVRYDDFEEAAQDYLDDHYDGIKFEWFSEIGRREIESAVCRDSEIWVDDDDLPGVWVFGKPGQ